MITPMRFPTTLVIPGRRLAFLHIPKAAGISLRNAVCETLGVEASNFIVDRSFFGEFDSFDQISPANRSLILFDETDTDDGCGFVGGHISLTTLQKHYGSSQIFTVLREPVTRLLSNWTFLRFLTDSDLDPWGAEWKRRNLLLLGSLKDFLSHPENQSVSDNLMLRMLLRPHPLIPPAAPIHTGDDEILIKEATARLDSLSFVDVMENPRLSSNVSGWLGQEIILPRLNATETVRDDLKRRLHAEMTAEVFGLLRARSRLDLRLWKMVAQDRLTNQEISHVRTRSMLGAIRKFRKLME